jgi:hypothetical protein
MAVHEFKLPFLAAVPVGSRVAIEVYDDNPRAPVIVDLATGIRWGSAVVYGPEFEKQSRLSRRSEVIVRGCWVGSNMGFTNVGTHTRLLVEEPPEPEGPYR